MKIKTEELKKIVEEVVRDALSEQEEEMVDPDQVAPASPAPAAAPDAGSVEKQKSDVATVLKYIQRVNTKVEYMQLLDALLRHVPNDDGGLKKVALKGILLNKYKMPATVIDNIFKFGK
jgi:uncharacterized protein with von Willebrand factor type A (vWA) domain